MNFLRFLPFLDLRNYDTAQARADLVAAITVTFTSVPQAIAYAMIAGLPPAMGLYAASYPTIVGSLFRSSSHVVAGPSNALSLLVGAGLGVLITDGNPATAAVTLAVMVGVFQILAGFLRLGVIVDFISSSVVLGYITGAGILIAIGQLPNLTKTIGARGDVLHRISVWSQGLGKLHMLSLAVGLATAALIVLMRKFLKKLPGPIIVLSLATAATMLLGLHEQGLKVVKDIKSIEAALPPLTLPDLSMLQKLLPLAVAATVLSLVESSAVARAIAARTKQRLDISVEFAGQGWANLAAGFSGGYPVSGSLSRSAINHQSGARSRLAGVFGGVMMLVVLLALGPVVNYTPIAALAGLLMVVAWDLVNRTRIAITMRSTWADRITFVATVLGTWSLSLDQAIYLGVALSLVFFLRQARLLTINELAIDKDGELHQLGPNADEDTPFPRCHSCRILQLEGHLFFGVEGELRQALDEVALDPKIKVLILRMKRTKGMDITVANVLQEAAEQYASQGRTLILTGVSPATMAILKETGVLETFRPEHVIGMQARWFDALELSIREACKLLEEAGCEEECPIREFCRTHPFREDRSVTLPSSTN